MQQVTIGIDWSSLKLIMGSYNNFKEDSLHLWMMLQQHRIVCSDLIKEEYERIATEEGEDANLVETMLTAMSDRCEFDYIADKGMKYVDTLKSKFKQLQQDYKYAYLDENNESKISKSTCRYRYKVKDLLTDENCIVYQFSAPSTFKLKQGDPAGHYLDYISTLLSNSEYVSIIDPYMLSETGGAFWVLKNELFTLLKRKTTINLHTDDSKIDPSKIQSITEYAKEIGVHVKLYKYRAGKMHARFITTDKEILQIDPGIDMFTKDKKIRLPAVFTYQKKKIPEKTPEYEIDFHGGRDSLSEELELC